MNYERLEDGRIVAYVNTAVPLTFIASGLYRATSGPHAKIQIKFGPLDQRTVARDTLNIDKDAQIVRLAGSAALQLSEQGQESLGDGVAKNARPKIIRYLNEFCEDLWDFHLGEIEAEDVAGDSDSPAVEYLLKPLVIAQGGHGLFALPGKGKSTVGLGLAIAIDAGIPVTAFGSTDRPAKVLYLNLERSKGSLAVRIAAMNRALGLDPHRPLLMVNRRGGSLEQMKEAVAKIIKHFNVELVVLDSISRAGASSLNNDDTMNGIMDTLNSWSVAWIVISHTSKKDDSTSYGSVMLQAAVDVEISLKSIRDETSGSIGVTLKVEKANDLPYTPPVEVAFDYDEQGVTTVRQPQPGEFIEEGSTSVGQTADQIKEHLGTVGKATATAIANDLDLNRSRVVEILQRNTFVRLPREGREVPYALRVVPRTSPIDTSNVSTPDMSMGHIPRTGQDMEASSRSVSRRETTSDNTLIECSRCSRSQLLEKYTPTGDPLCANCADEVPA